MKIVKKSFALLLCLALVICTVPMLVSATDDYDSVPAFVESDNMFTIYEGAAFAGTFGSNKISGQGHLPGYNPAQKTFAAGSVSGYDLYEFDFFLDNISIITARNVKLYFNLRSGTGSGSSRGMYEFQDQITQSGWNHIKVEVSLSDDILDILTMARFYIDIDAGSTGASDRYRIANIAATNDAYKVVPEITQSTNVFVMGEGAAFAGTFGSDSRSEGHLPGYGSGNTAQKTFAAGSVSGYDYFEFDFYIDNTAVISARNINLYLNLRSGTENGTSRGMYEFQDQITQSGWNHIKITVDLSEDILDILTMARFYIDIDAGSAGAAVRYRIANIYAVRVPYLHIPEITQGTGVLVLGEGSAFAGTLGSSAITGQGHLPGYSPAKITITAENLSDYGCFEFDFYVENISNLTARNTKLYLSARNSGDYQITGGSFQYQDQLIQSGWNHIKVVTGMSSSDLALIKHIRFYIDIDADDASAADRYRVANVCATDGVELGGHRLVLDDCIGVNFFVDLAGLSASEKAASYMTFDVTAGTGAHASKTGLYNDSNVNGSGDYGFTCKLSSVDMAETIIPTFHYTKGNAARTVTGVEYSAKAYIDYVNANAGTGEYSDAVVALVKAIGNYGYYAQQYFTTKTPRPTALAASYKTETYDSDKYTSTKTATASYAASASGVTNGTASGNYQYNLNFGSNISVLVRIYGNNSVDFGTPAMAGGTYNSKYTKYITVGAGAPYNQIDLAIPILNLNKPITISGTLNSNAFTVTASGYSYIYGILNKAGAAERTKNLVCALYDYHIAAAAAAS